MNRAELIETLKNYNPYNETEARDCFRMIELLNTYENCFSRDLLFAHFTASSWVTNFDESEVLLIHHKKLNRWLQPGGHCDGDENVKAVAEKELLEETGLICEAEPHIFDLDIHAIPERKGVPAHEHFDIRFLFKADSRQALIQNHETNALKWIPIEELNAYCTEDSMLRMRDKLNK
ncbi:NUDIX hydrolase [Marinilongibacter aquaticus]|uniref:NUDIX hydrolase n=1 Tax=Marinilongibacter aquaticus TaxID=2975157 RepID=UPI0021BDADAB|nr:NUDIX hydrolase [Marinilongibacter aquaticus]UBM59425.1 NUDIX hydrolase [Marinilongibacter aquaticus]